MTLTLTTIVLIDDKPSVLDQWQTLLSDHFQKIIAVTNGIQALEVCDNIIPDVILSDLDMPIMDGFELLKTLKSNPKTAQIPIVICSSTTDITTQYLCKTLGALEYLEKPLDVAKLLSALEASRQELPVVA